MVSLKFTTVVATVALIGIVEHAIAGPLAAIQEIAASVIETGTTAATGAARVASTAGKVGQAASEAVEFDQTVENAGQAASNVAEAGKTAEETGQTPEKAGQAVEPNIKTAESIAKGNTNNGVKVSSPLKKAGKEIIKQTMNNQQTNGQSSQNQPTNPQQNQGTQQLKQQPLKGSSSAQAANSRKTEAGEEKPENRRKLEGANTGITEAAGGAKQKTGNGGDNVEQKNTTIKSGSSNAEPKAKPKEAPPKELKMKEALLKELKLKSSSNKKNWKRQDPGLNTYTYARPVMRDNHYIEPAAFPAQYTMYAQNLFSSTFLCLVGQQAPLVYHYEGNTLVPQGLAEP